MIIKDAVLALADKHIVEYSVRNGELVAKECPFCHGGDNHDKNTFGISLYNGVWSCKRGSCGRSGTFKTLMEEFNDHFEVDEDAKTLFGNKKIKVWDRPDETKYGPVTDAIRAYFATRCISEETMNAFHIMSDSRGNIVFPFYRDGQLVYVKYRKPKAYNRKEDDMPKEWQDKNTEPILFNMDGVSFNEPLFITEGEFDAMSLYEAGVTNVVSVPCGCNNLEWVNLCWDWLENFRMIVLFGDSDEPGMVMMQTLVKRLGEDRCMIAPMYPEFIMNDEGQGRICKDANEILFSYGRAGLKDVADHCEPAPVEGVLNLSAVPYVDPSSIPRIYSRIPELDQAIGGFGEGCLTVISGKRGEGKSTISGGFLLNGVEQGYKVAAYSGELSALQFRDWIMAQACERKFMTYKQDIRNGKNYAMVPYEVQERIKDWLDEKFFLFDNSFVDQGTMVESVIKRFTLCARRYGCKLFLVDNLMMLTSGIEEELKQQAKITAALKQFAVRFKAHVILVAHPRKTPANQTFNSEDVAGSAAITNLADIVMCIEKPNIRVTKNREFGDTPYIHCSYDPSTRRIFQTSYGDRTVYGWDHSGIQQPDISVEDLASFAIQDGSEEMPF